MRRFLVVVCVLVLGWVVWPAAPSFSREASRQELESRTHGELERQMERKRSRYTHSRKAKAAAQKINIAFLTQAVPVQPPLSNLDPVITDEGIYGAQLGIQDDATTGQFTNQDFSLREVTVPLKGDLVAAFKGLVADGYQQIIVDLPAVDILRLADLPEAKKVLIYNTSARDDRLRNKDCRANVFQIIPSRAMLADALAQYLVKKRWNKWFLVIGPNKGDRLYAAAIRRAAKRFGAKVVKERTWEHTYDLRRTAQAEVPVFTKGVDYDIMIVADEIGNFGEYLMYQTWYPKLVAGTQGLVPTAWHRTHERWGATQMQNRFRRLAKRWMTPVDYAAWIAVRTIGEAATRTKSVAFGKLKQYMLSPDFALGIFKGLKATYRPWDQQLRMRILLASPRALVSVSPQKEFLHPVSSVDTLGYDKPETGCHFK